MLLFFQYSLDCIVKGENVVCDCSVQFCFPFYLISWPWGCQSHNGKPHNLTQDEVGSLYRFENPFVWFLVSTNECVNNSNLEKSFGTKRDILKVKVPYIANENETRIIVILVTPTIKE